MEYLAGDNGLEGELLRIELSARDEAARMIGHHDLRRLERSGLRVIFTADDVEPITEESYDWGDLAADFFYLVSLRDFLGYMAVIGIMFALAMILRTV